MYKVCLILILTPSDHYEIPGCILLRANRNSQGQKPAQLGIGVAVAYMLKKILL